MVTRMASKIFCDGCGDELYDSKTGAPAAKTSIMINRASTGGEYGHVSLEVCTPCTPKLIAELEERLRADIDRNAASRAAHAARMNAEAP